MNKIKFNLLDNNFSHDRYSVAGRDSEYIEWDRSCSDKKIPTFFSHDYMYWNTDNFGVPLGWFFESKSIFVFGLLFILLFKLLLFVLF